MSPRRRPHFYCVSAAQVPKQRQGRLRLTAGLPLTSRRSDMEQRRAYALWKLVSGLSTGYGDTVWNAMPASFMRRRLLRLQRVIPGSWLRGFMRQRRRPAYVSVPLAPAEAWADVKYPTGAAWFAAQENRFLCSVANILSKAVAGVVSEDEGRLEFEEAHEQLEPGRRRERIDHLVGTVTETTHRLRQLVADLRPAALEDGDVPQALRVFLDMTRSEADPVWSVRSQIMTDIHPPQSIALYRMTQEALVNVRRHACAARAEVLLAETAGGFLVRVQDDGKGFAPPERRARSPRAGLDAMRVRAELAGGSFRLQSTPGGGTTVEFWLPAMPALATGNHGVT